MWEANIASAGSSGADFGSASDDDLLAAGRKACSYYDTGADYKTVRAMMALELPDDANDNAHTAVAMIAAMTLCGEYADEVTAAATGS